MDTQTVIQEIHAAFDCAKTDETRLRYKPAKMSEVNFLERLERFRTFYPQHNFITEAEVAEICKKYGLLLGHDIFFSGYIPKRAADAMESFRLLGADAMFETRQNLFEMFADIPGDVSFQCDTTGEGRVVVQCSFVEHEHTRSVVPIGERFVLIYGANADAKFDVYERVPYLDSEWLVHVTTLRPERLSISRRMQDLSFASFFPNAPARGLRIMLSVEFYLLFSEIDKASRFDIRQKAARQVVAPASMFQRYAEAVEIRDDYRIVFKRPEVPPPGMFGGLDDPIVLQPVDGGFLVVTKWGPEAILPEAINENLN